MSALPGPTATITPILPAARGWPLHDVAASRALEQAALASQPAHALMQRAGLAVARLALAIAPHARRVWVAAGPGNNGGDGLVAALHLQRWGLQVQVSLLGEAQSLPADAADAWQQARAAGVPISTDLPAQLDAELCIDALLGLGATREPAGLLAAAIQRLNTQRAPVLAVDLPSGLCANTGRPLGAAAVQAQHTLSLLTLKPGLFTGAGRDHAGRVWLATLGIDGAGQPASAWLGGMPPTLPRRHSQHKGSFGDVIVLGGAAGMGGAALLAARAALTAGAGRVWVARLAGDALAVDAARPELMPREPADLLQPDTLARATVVCGCGGGAPVQAVLPAVLAHAGRLVLDADALNAMAADAGLAAALIARQQPTVLTPHPLEAARLLGCSAAQVQADRLASAMQLAERLRAVLVLKGSGSVLAAPGRPPSINPTGNARLGTAGSGDVLAGWLGGLWSQGDSASLDDALAAARAAVWWHGRAAETGPPHLPLRAGDLIEAMAAAVSAAAPAAKHSEQGGRASG
ncbi:NAD(P)H-hydrate dehydratase [Aquabacterium sp. OR-4]|uniref:NAD(P)H-hydrate dehydratase n=1 Tax=Aquabacterium sp. OR-4 TaxID=2978127 RepID=UPI0021B47CEE|nr:NAD(P)H-hydrate dehydratase [Aquabacterium sp. OR-4]MDT7835465.1 NAD(P)H-hydrate dehydratase [Aquabacterium sp. OR-4]